MRKRGSPVGYRVPAGSTNGGRQRTCILDFDRRLLCLGKPSAPMWNPNRAHTALEDSRTVEQSYLRRPVPLGMCLLLALLLHGPLLSLQLPLSHSYDANFHVFFASHYAQHWFDPWNEK